MASQLMFKPANAASAFCKTRVSQACPICLTRPTCKARFQPQHAEELGQVQLPERSPSVPVQQGAASSHKIIGLGARGISALNRLAGSGHLTTAKFMAIDGDRKVWQAVKQVLATASSAVECLEVSTGDDVTLQPAELAAISGPVEPGQLGEFRPDGVAGAAFVMGSALGSPGGATLMLQLVRHLRRQGHFVAAALTRPFTFEGARKMEQADALIEMMEEVAHLVVVVDQGVLTRASPDMTMSEACAIADKTLQYTVRSIMWALSAPEILKVSGGAFLWHGRDLRAMKRPLFPPMMSLLTCPGHAYLGRGQAALPPGNANDVSLASLLSTLAEDATHAASESPFLDGHMASASAVLCILIFPREVVDPAAVGKAGKPAQSSGTYQDNYREYALRSAVQVAALTVRELAGPHCRDMVVCPQVREEADSQQPPTTATTSHGDASEVAPIMVECALLVIKGSKDTATAGAAKPRGASASGTPSPSPTPPSTRLGSWAHAQLTRPQPQQQPAQPQQQQLPQRGPARQQSAHPAQRQMQQQNVSPSQMPPPAPSRPVISRPLQATPAWPVPTATAQPPAAQPTTATPAWQAMSMIAGGSASAAHNVNAHKRALGAGRPLPAAAPGQAGPSQQQPSSQPSASRPSLPARQRSDLSSTGGEDASNSCKNINTGPLQIPRVAGNLVSSLVATSLDLPPHAAKWRHKQRHTGKPKSVYEIHDAANVVEEEIVGEGGEGSKPSKRMSLAALLLGRAQEEEPEADLRSRVAGMLEKERDF